ncbi:MAG TPA: PH domain-containing protein [Streptosporangiaceae bacterium]
MSTPQAAAPGKSVWKTDEAGRTTFRLNAPLVLWWCWVVFAVGNLIDLAVQSRDWFSLEITGALLVVTGFMYACALRPRVISDASGLTVRNPFRDYQVPWGRMAGVFLGDSVEVQYEQPPAEPKTIYSWALYSPRRARARAELKMATGMRRSQYNQRQQRRYQVDPSASYGKAPAQAREMSRQHPSHVMAGELGRRWTEAQAAGAGAEGTVVARWAWWSIVGVIVPIAFLVFVIVAH